MHATHIAIPVQGYAELRRFLGNLPHDKVRPVIEYLDANARSIEEEAAESGPSPADE